MRELVGGVSPLGCDRVLDAPSRSPDVVRASSLWLVLRILTLFLVLTGTMVLDVLKLDGVFDLLGMSERDLMVSFGHLYFCWSVWSLVVAHALERSLHGTQDPELCAS